MFARNPRSARNRCDSCKAGQHCENCDCCNVPSSVTGS